MLTDDSGLSAEVIDSRGYTTVVRKARLRELGFSDSQARVPALLIPLYNPQGEVSSYQIRADTPRVNRDGKAVKYETPRGSRMTLDVHPLVRNRLGDPSIPLWVTEGVKKGDALVTCGCCAVALLGVWTWRGTNGQGGKVALPEWEDIALNGRPVYVAFDSDVMTKPAVHAALARLGAFLQQRGAEVFYVYLPGGASGAKVGVDDFLASGHTVDDLLQLASPDLRKPEGDRVPEGEYQETDGGSVWMKQTRDGVVPVLLANFSARIVTEVVEDDGMECRESWQIEARGTRRQGRVTVTPGQFVAMAWPGDALGATAIVEPGQGLKDRLRHAIQTLSGEPARRHVYAHTGWRQIDGQWVYLHGGGAMGPLGPVSGIETALSGAAQSYILPEPPDGDELRRALRASLGILELAPDSVTVPTLGCVYRSVLGACDASVWIMGPTGSGKSELAALCVQHLGAGMDRLHLPESWTSTANALEGAAFMLKDSLLVIDDFAPEGTTIDIQRLHQVAASVIRRQGNLQGRSRMQANLSLRPARPPRGSLLATGEDVPRGQSVRARLLVCELGPNDLDFGKLAALQAIAASGVLASGMAGYVRWLAGHYGAFEGSMRQSLMDLRVQAVASTVHRRTPDVIAQLALGWKTWLAFAVECGAISQKEADSYWRRAWQALGEQVTAQQEYQASADPVRRFAELLVAAIVSGTAHLADRDGREPVDAERWGWRVRETGSGEYTRQDAQPQGNRIGWVDGDKLYLEPDAAYAAAQRLGQATGDPLAVQSKTLWRRLLERGVILGRNEGRSTLQVRGLEGAQRRVIVVSPSYLESGPSGPSGPAEGEPESESACMGPQSGATPRVMGASVAPASGPSRTQAGTNGATGASGATAATLEGVPASMRDGQVVYVLDLAEAQGFPFVTLRAGVSVLAGESAWRKFAEGASAEDLALASAGLEVLGK